ncbi:MAG: hypothetical protein Q4D43_10505, partial [Clostridia bacterium]|nr:hypothetical protein [Clostridia bacterium]
MAKDNAEKQNAPLCVGDVTERRHNRWLLVFYDLIIFAVSFWGAIIYKRIPEEATSAVIVWQLMLSLVLIFGMRFFLKVYKSV